MAVTCHKIDAKTIDISVPNVPIGRPAPGLFCDILDANLKPVTPGDQGELYISGPCLARGYHQDHLTADKFLIDDSVSPPRRRYKTGDLCRLAPNGSLEYFGRTDQQLKILGYRIEPGEIEEKLRHQPEIQDALVLAFDDKKNEPYLIAYVVLKKNSPPLLEDALRHDLGRSLPSYMIPSRFIFIETLPLTANGKLDHASLPSPCDLPTQREHAPKTSLEKKIAKIWAKELNLNAIGRYSNFYELGGHSLNAARIVSQINQTCRKKITFQEFYQASTIHAMAALLSEKPKSRRQRRVLLTKASATASHTQEHHLSDFQLLLWITKIFEPKAQRLNLVSRKRLHGPCNQSALQHALGMLLARHPLLQVQISSLYPSQKLISSMEPIRVEETDLRAYTTEVAEQILFTSLHDLTHFYPWPKQRPLLRMRLFYVDEHTIELHMALPHLISDDHSLEIFWDDLSLYYQHALTNTPTTLSIEPTTSFMDYVSEEKKTMDQSYHQDCTFWRQYFNDTQHVMFCAEHVVTNMVQKKIHYSTYHAIAPELVERAVRFCAHHHINMDDLLCGAVGITLGEQAHQPLPGQGFILHLVKSTRHQAQYDRTIGCFLRIDPIKIIHDTRASLLSVAKSIRQRLIEEANPLMASSILKLAFLTSQHNPQKKTRWLQGLLSMYLKLLHSKQLDYKSLQFGAHLSSFNRGHCFIIYVNIWNNFLKQRAQTPTTCLGLPVQNTPMFYSDLSSFDNLCDITFLCDDQQEQPYIVISSNLTLPFRASLARRIEYILSENIHVCTPQDTAGAGA